MKCEWCQEREQSARRGIFCERCYMVVYRIAQQWHITPAAYAALVALNEQRQPARLPHVLIAAGMLISHNLITPTGHAALRGINRYKPAHAVSVVL